MSGIAPTLAVVKPIVAASGVTLVNWWTMTPADPTDFHTTYTATVSYQANDLLLVTQAGDNGPTGSISGVPVTDTASNGWGTSSNSKYISESGWSNNSMILWYVSPTSAGSSIVVTADASSNTLYPEAGGCALYQFRPPSGQKLALDSPTGNIGSGAFGTTGSLTLSSTSGAGLVFIRAVGNEDNTSQTFTSSKGTALGLTNSKQSWTGSTNEGAGWAAYLVTTTAQSSLVCNFTATQATHIGMAMDSFVLEAA